MTMPANATKPRSRNTLRSQAAGVSRSLSAAGLRPLASGTSRRRQGIRVTRGHQTVVVTIDLDLDRETAILTEDVTAALHTAGYTVRPNPHSASILYVTHPRFAL